MTVLYIVIALVILAGIGFGIWRYQQKRASDKVEKEAEKAALIEKLKAKNPDGTFKDLISKVKTEIKK